MLSEDIAKFWYLRDGSRTVMYLHDFNMITATSKHLGSSNQDCPANNWSSILL